MPKISIYVTVVNYLHCFMVPLFNNSIIVVNVKISAIKYGSLIVQCDMHIKKRVYIRHGPHLNLINVVMRAKSASPLGQAL